MPHATTHLHKEANRAKNSAKWVLFLIPLVLIGPLSMDMYLPALPLIKGDLHTSEETVQWTLSIFLLGFGLSQLLIGESAARWGRGKMILAGSALYLLSTAALVFSSNVALIVLLRFLQALGSCACMVLSMAFVRTHVSDLEESTKSYSILSGSTAIAPIIAPIVGSFCIELTGSWRSIFALLSLFMAAGAAIYYYKFGWREEQFSIGDAPLNGEKGGKRGSSPSLSYLQIARSRLIGPPTSKADQ